MVAVLLHAGVAALLFLLLLRAGTGRWPAAAGALFWGLHPATVEVTAWACSLGDSLCGLFAVASLLAYAYDRRVLAHLSLVVALFAKEHAVVVPALWLAWDFFLRRERIRMRSVALGPAIGLALAIGFLVFRSAVGAKMAQLSGPLGGSYGAAILMMLAGLGWYAASILFPYGSTFNARVPIQESLFSFPVFAGIVVLVALAAGMWRGSKYIRLSCAWFLIALVPVSNVVVPLKIPTADRFLYLPLMGLAFAAAVVVRRASPRVALAGVPAVLVLLALLTGSRIGDWKDDRALIAAGNRVNPKDKALIWAEAALTAKRATEMFRAGNSELAGELAASAGDLYRQYLQNAMPWEQLSAHMELGDLWWEVGQWAHRVDHKDYRMALSRSLESYLAAHRLQIVGRGRVIDEEVHRAAQQIVRLCLLLAEPSNPGFERVVKQGFDTLRFLEQRYGEQQPMAFLQLLLVHSAETRGGTPETAAKARKGLDFVWSKLPDLEKEGHWTTFMRAQTLMFLSILRDRQIDREGVEQAYELYLKAARERRGFRIQALMYAGRAACVIATQFKDLEWKEKGIAILEGLPDLAKKEGLRLTRFQERERFTFTTTCGR